MNPYEKCPVYENEKYLLRLVEPGDAPDLLRVYSDRRAVPFFNSDNCNGDDFHYTTLERMQSAIDFWLTEYRRGDFVRWAVIDQKSRQAIGTIELFHRRADDFFDHCGLLRLDLGSGYERTEEIADIMSLIVPPAWELFGCDLIATKIPPSASARRAAMEQMGFAASEEKLIGGDDHRSYSDYYILRR